MLFKNVPLFVTVASARKISCSFLFHQESEKDDLPESVIEINGCAGSIFAPYHRPAFPSTVPPPLPTVDITEERIREQETLENRLVQW